MEQQPRAGEPLGTAAGDAERAAWEEIELLAEVMIRGGTADHRLTGPEIDAALGLPVGHRVSAA